MAARTETVTILFTDLVGSTEMLQRAGDEQAQQVLKAHHLLLRESVEAHRGHEVKWLGDGLMVAFRSTTDAVACAIAMQQASRRPTGAEHLEIRAGLNVGEVTVDGGDYSGSPVVIARRLCDRASSGQIYASEIVARLVDDRGGAIHTRELGQLELKGIIKPVSAVEIVYTHDVVAMLRKTPFIGRTAEVKALRRSFDQAVVGSGGVAALVGEPGIGKTRMIDEFCATARGSGVQVLVGRCYDGEVAPPFSPFIEALLEYVNTAPLDELQETLGVDAPIVARIVPAILHKLPGTTARSSTQAEGEHYQLLQAVSDVLGRISKYRPVLVVLDDMHWADKGTVAMFNAAARASTSQRILFIAAFREVEVERTHPLSTVLTGLTRDARVDRISLGGLGTDNVGTLLDVVTGQSVARSFAESIATETSGNPFFIREVLLHLIEEEKLSIDGVGWIATLPARETRIPEGVRDLIGRRLSRLSENCNDLLASSSALTGGFSWAEIAAFMRQGPEEDLLDALDEAVSAGLIVETSSGSYDFVHALVRVTLYDLLSTPRRARLHQRIADAFELLYASGIDDHAAVLAHHFFEALTVGSSGKALLYTRLAGDLAMESYAYDDAEAQYKRALAVIEGLPQKERDAVTLCELLMARSFALRCAGEGEAGWDALMSAVAAARQAELGEHFAEAVARARSFGGDYHHELWPLQEEALRMLPPTDSAIRAMLMLDASESRAYKQKPEEAESIYDESLAMAERLADERLHRKLLVKRTVLWQRSREDCVGHVARAKEIIRSATAAGDEEDVAYGLTVLLEGQFESGDIEGFEHTLDRFAGVASELRQPGYQSIDLRARAALALFVGRFADARSLAYESYQVATRVNPDFAQRTFAIQLFGVRREVGRLDKVAPALAALVQEREETNVNSENTDAAFQSALALVCAETGDLDGASKMFDRLAVREFGEIPRDGSWISTIAMTSEVCAILRHGGHARRLYDMLLPYARRNIVTTNLMAAYGSTSRYLGLLADTLGLFDEAADFFTDAVTMNDEMGARPSVVRSRVDHARMLIRRATNGDARRALVLINEALTSGRELGMAKVVADCEALVADLG